jgi:hypothetical protein
MIEKNPSAPRGVYSNKGVEGFLEKLLEKAEGLTHRLAR